VPCFLGSLTIVAASTDGNEQAAKCAGSMPFWEMAGNIFYQSVSAIRRFSGDGVWDVVFSRAGDGVPLVFVVILSEELANKTMVIY